MKKVFTGDEKKFIENGHSKLETLGKFKKIAWKH